MKEKQKGERRSLSAFLSRLTDVPQDAFSSPCGMEVYRDQVLCEGCRGILEFNDTLLRIRMKNGDAEIRGTDLTLRTLSSDLLIAEGRIRSVGYPESGKEG